MLLVGPVAGLMLMLDRAQRLAAAVRHDETMDDHEIVRWTRTRLVEFAHEPALR